MAAVELRQRVQPVRVVCLRLPIPAFRRTKPGCRVAPVPFAPFVATALLRMAPVARRLPWHKMRIAEVAEAALAVVAAAAGMAAVAAAVAGKTADIAVAGIAVAGIAVAGIAVAVALPGFE